MYLQSNQRIITIPIKAHPPFIKKDILDVSISEMPLMIQQDIIIFPLINGKIVCKNIRSNEQLWEVDLNDIILVNKGNCEEFRISIIIVEDKIFCSYLNGLILLDVNKGKLLDILSKDEMFITKSSLCFNGNVFFESISQGGIVTLKVLNTNKTSNLVWSKKLKFPSFYSAFSDGKIFLLTGKNETTLECLNSSTGKTYWKNSDFKKRICGIPLVFDKKLIIASTSLLNIIDIDTGNLIFSIQVEERNPVSYTCSKDYIYYLGTNDFYVFCFKTGKIIRKTCKKLNWEQHRINSPKTILTKSTSHLFFGATVEGILSAVNIETGDVDWTYSCKDGFSFDDPPILISNHLMAKDYSGNFYCFKMP